mmetsp:Transcript_56793/g.122785  ORF Transcript_56793/g.122785 Transcript_56793/m.122785 type:complete len:204 (-) Transcript_56793:103-714(-)
MRPLCHEKCTISSLSESADFFLPPFLELLRPPEEPVLLLYSEEAPPRGLLLRALRPFAFQRVPAAVPAPPPRPPLRPPGECRASRRPWPPLRSSPRGEPRLRLPLRVRLRLRRRLSWRRLCCRPSRGARVPWLLRRRCPSPWRFSRRRSLWPPLRPPSWPPSRPPLPTFICPCQRTLPYLSGIRWPSPAGSLSPRPLAEPSPI